jgi:hypothetical protein
MAAMESMEDEKSREIARVLSAASEQIGLALKDSQPPIDSLGTSLARLAVLLAGDLNSAAAVAQLQIVRQEMTKAVTGLQFYDRMTQHLTHVQDYLAASASEIGTPASVGTGSWEKLSRKLSDRLLSDTHRMYLGKNFPAEYLASLNGGSAGNREKSPSGDIDLF